MNIKHLTCSSIAAVLLAGSAATASAAIIHFDQSGLTNTGNVSYDGDGGPATGSDIVFGSISGDDTPQNASDNLTDGNVLQCQDCRLSFTTGDNQQEGAENGGPDNTYIFGQNGSFEITGTAIDSDGNTISESNTLLTGSFSSNPSVSSGADNSLTFSSNGTDTKDAGILNYFGYSADTPFLFSNTVISLSNATFDASGAFNADVTNADVDNSPQQAVPEPQEFGMLALGFALLGLGMAFRRKGNSAS